MATSLANLTVAEGAKNKRFIKGRGRGTGNGKTAGKGQKGQGAHAHTKKGGFEGGQLPIYRRLPKFGVRKTHRHIKVEYAIVNLEQLNVFEDGALVDSAILLQAGLIKKELDGVKILGRGTLNKKLTVKAAAFSNTAKEAIEKLGGTCEVTE